MTRWRGCWIIWAWFLSDGIVGNIYYAAECGKESASRTQSRQIPELKTRLWALCPRRLGLCVDFWPSRRTCPWVVQCHKQPAFQEDRAASWRYRDRKSCQSEGGGMHDRDPAGQPHELSVQGAGKSIGRNYQEGKCKGEDDRLGGDDRQLQAQGYCESEGHFPRRLHPQHLSEHCQREFGRTNRTAWGNGAPHATFRLDHHGRSRICLERVKEGMRSPLRLMRVIYLLFG